MKVADGLEVSLFAAEPDLWNPTTIDIDAQGRVWVCEARNYRLFNQQITDKAGDRIRVLDDTDGDGRCDNATTFYQDAKLQAPMGIAVLGDRVYVCQSPDLFYLEDTDKDGVADKRTVILTGFGGVDQDHAIHGVSFGPDGLLYFSNGDQGLDVTDKRGNRVHVGKNAPHMAACVMRCDLEGEHLELIAEGMRNPYEPTVDPFGNVFISDNDDDGNEQCRVNFVIDGANYGYWPRRKGDRHLDEVHWNTDRPGVMPTMVKTGFGSPTGLMFYQGTLLPEPYQNALIHADAGPRVIRAYKPEIAGAGLTAIIETLVVNEVDTWFRPSDVCAAPDGSIFISDWYDPGVGGHRMGDVSRGRIYRLAPKGVPYNVPPLDLGTSAGLGEAFHSSNQARRYLACVAVDRLIQSGGDIAAIESSALTSGLPNTARWMWLKSTQGDAGSNALEAYANSDSAYARAHAMRMQKRAGDIDGLLVRAATADAFARRQLLIELASENGDPNVAKVLVNLATQYDGHDRVYRESVGIAFRGKESWAFNEVIARVGDDWDARLAGIVTQLHPPDVLPLAKTALANKKLDSSLRNSAMDALDAIGTNEAGQQITGVLTTDAPADIKAHALHLLARNEGDAWREVIDGREMKAYLGKALAAADLRGGVLAFIGETRLVPMLGDVVAIACDTATPTDQCVDALSTVQKVAARANRNDTAPYLKQMSLLIESTDPAMRAAAVQAIGAFKGDEPANALERALLNADAPLEVRREVLHALGASRSGANLLIALAEKQEMPQDLVLDATDMLNSNSSEQIRLLAQKVLPRATTREGHALPPLKDLLAMPGDAARGKDVFFSPDRAQCYRCHVINGEGKLVGPDLSKIGQKASRENLLDSILNPSAAVAPEYKVWIVSSFEEGALSGFLRADTTEAVELMDSAGVTIRLDPKDVLDRAESSASLMPTGLSAALTAQELADIVAYLGTLK